MDFVQREGRMGRVGPNESKDNEETCRSVLIMLEDLGHPLDLKFIHDFRDIDKADGEDENDIEELFSRLEKIESIQIISDSEIQKFFSDQPSIFRKNILEIDEYLAEYGSPIKQTLTQLGRLFFSYVSFYGHGPVLNVIEKIDKYSSKHLKKVSLYDAMDSLLPGAVFTWQKKRYVVQKWYNWSLLLTASFYDRGIIFVEKLENIEEKYQKLHEYKKIHSKTTWKNIAFESREGLFGELKFQSLQIRILNSENGEEIDKKSCEWNPFIKPILTYCIEASVPGTIEEGHHFCHSIIHALWEIESLAMDEFGHLVMDLGKGIIKILFYENEPSGILERISWEGILDRAGALFMEPWDALRVPFCYLKVNEVFQPVKEDYQNLKRSFYENILSLIDR